MYNCSNQSEEEKNVIMDSGGNDKSGAESHKCEIDSEID